MPEAILNSEEINALMDAIQSSKFSPEAPQHGDAVNYDLVSQDRAIRGQMPTLDAINAEIATEFEMGIAKSMAWPFSKCASSSA